MMRPSFGSSRNLGMRGKQINPKIKLLVLLLRRNTNRALNDYFSIVKDCGKRKEEKVRRMSNIFSITTRIWLFKSWQKLKDNVTTVKSRKRILKDVLVLCKRIEHFQLRFSFDKLHKNVFITNSNSFDRVMASRKIIMFQAIRKAILNKKKSAWFKLNSNMLAKKVAKRLMVVNFILKSAKRRHLLQAWNRICSYGNQGVQEDGKLEDLQLQLQDLKVQVQNKNSNINRLQEEISELKQHSSYKHPESSSFIYHGTNNRSYTGLHRSKNKFNSSFDKDSNDGSLVRDPSFGSLLGGSFVSYRSKGSLSKANMNDSSNSKQNNCNCSYKEKYTKYKASNQTLKKQLDIIKTQLQFTKDMNEHMENQIRVHLGDSEKDQKIDKLRQDLKESHKEKEALKEKVLKYEKYVNKLKLEFKTKIEEIYRRVKKSA